MSGSIATAFVSIKADTKGFKGQVESSVEDTAQSAGAKFAGIFGAVAFGAGLKRTIDAASDLNETVSKTKQIFDQSAQQIEDWAQDAAKNLGLSKRAAMDGAATFAIFGQAAGLAGQDLVGFSTDLVQLASDLASFNNTSPEEAIQAIGAALRGESEPIRAYGVLLDDATLKAKAFEMGIYDGTGVLTQQQRVLAAQAEILAQTTTQQGDFARTADGAANAQRIATAEAENAAASLGQNFLPIYTKVVEIVGALANAFGSLPGPVQTAVVALIGITVLAGPLSGVAGGIKAITTAVMGLSPAMRTLSLSMGAVGALVGLAVIAYQVYSGRKKEAEARTKGLRDALLGEAAAQNEALVALAENDKAVRAYLVSAKELGFTNQALAQFVRDGTGALASYASGWQDITETTDGVYPQLFELAKLIGDPSLIQGATNAREWAATVDSATMEVVAGYRDFITESVALREAEKERQSTQELVNTVTGETADAADDAADSIEGQKEQADAAAAATKLLKESLEPTRTAFDEAADAADALADAIERVFGGSMNLEEATRNLQQAGDDLAASFEENGATLDVFTEAGRNNRQAIQDQVESILDYGVAMVGAGQTTDEATDAVAFLTEGLKEQLRQAGLTEEQIDEYLTTLGLTPENVTTSIELANDQQSKEKLEAILDDLGDIDAGAAAEIQALIDEGKYAEAERRLRRIEATRTVKVDLAPGRGLTLTGIQGASRVFLSANGGYFPAKSGGYMVNLAEAGQAEAVLPLERPSRLAEMLNDPRIGGPIAEAMGGGGGGGVATIMAAPAAPMVVQFVVNDRVVQEMLVAADRQTRGAR
jgi:hypothetical protein